MVDNFASLFTWATLCRNSYWMTSPDSVCSKMFVLDYWSLWSGLSWSKWCFSFALDSEYHKANYFVSLMLTLIIYPSFANSVDPDQLASEEKPTDLDLHCLPFSIWIYINNLDQVIRLAENLKRVWHLNLFSMTRVKWLFVFILMFHWRGRVY